MVSVKLETKRGTIQEEEGDLSLLEGGQGNTEFAARGALLPACECAQPGERARLHAPKRCGDCGLHARTGLQRPERSVSGLAPLRPADCATAVDEEAFTSSGRLFCPISSISELPATPAR
jgi:hypothetical protein